LLVAARVFVQACFTRILEKRDWRVDPARGRFRAFLLAALKNFLANERDRELADKRGGGARVLSFGDEAERRFALKPVGETTPERIYERGCALALLDAAMERLAAEQHQARKLPISMP
jgi:RNA polymerase sigma-70 factor (ECF subfamily)